MQVTAKNMHSLESFVGRLVDKENIMREMFDENDHVLEDFETRNVEFKKGEKIELHILAHKIFDKTDFYWRYDQELSSEARCARYVMISKFSKKVLGRWPKPLLVRKIFKHALNFCQFPAEAESIVSRTKMVISNLPDAEMPYEEVKKIKLFFRGKKTSRFSSRKKIN